MTEYMHEYSRWKKHVTDEALASELEAMDGNEDEILFRFGSALSFGTAGIRGTMAPGRNAMNIYTVAQATTALAQWINEQGKGDRGVIIGYDSRINSSLFAKTAAAVLAEYKVKVYLYDSLRPTPMVSFGTRYLGCAAGITITASHNPKEYNGYKVYYEDGAQIDETIAADIQRRIAKIDFFDDLVFGDFDMSLADGTIKYVGEELDEIYKSLVLGQRVNADAVPAVADKLKIVYSPFHGTGYRLVPEVLRECGLKYLYTVDAQMIPDGNFPTVASPNPENAEGFALGIELANKVGADLIIATDPDADRVGVMARTKDGDFTTITGNQMGALLIDYILTAYKNKGMVPADAYAVKTIVTSELAQKVCDSFGIKMYNVLTGFKYIGEVMESHVKAGVGTFVLGYEESYGYLKGMYARDKDAVVASMLICEMAAFYMAKGMTLADAREDMFIRYGYYAEKTVSITFGGLGASEKISSIIEGIRADMPKSVAGTAITEWRDYRSGIIHSCTDESEVPTGLPSSNVLFFRFSDGSAVVVRPSGTEPKVKLYVLAAACRSSSDADARLAALTGEFKSRYFE